MFIIKRLIFVIICINIFSNISINAAENRKIETSKQQFIVDGYTADVNALNIDGYNYVKVSELAELLDIDISYDPGTGTVSLDKSRPFTQVRTVEKSDALNIERITLYTRPSMFPYSTVIHVTSDLKLTEQQFDWIYDYFGDTPQAPLESTERLVTEENYNRLVASILDNSFVTLPKEINNKDILDGASVYMEVQIDGVSHIVGGYMPQETDERFKNIYTEFRKLSSPATDSSTVNTDDGKIPIEVDAHENRTNSDIKLSNIQVSPPVPIEKP